MRQDYVGLLNPGWLTIGSLAILAGYAFSWVWLTAPPDHLSNVLNVGPALAIAVGAMYLTVSSRVIIQGETCVKLVNFLVIRELRLSAIDSVDANEGLRLVTISGRRLSSFAYGASLAGRIVGYRRAQKLANEIEIRMAELRQGQDNWRRGDVEVRTKLRIRGLVVAIALGAVLLGVAALIVQFRVGRA